MPLIRRLHPLLLVAVTFVAYHATFSAPFLFDDAQFVKGSALHTLSWAVVQGTTRPIVQLSLALNWAGGGADVVGYHVVNFVVHVLAAPALYGIVRRTLACIDGPTRASIDRPTPASAPTGRWMS